MYLLSHRMGVLSSKLISPIDFYIIKLSRIYIMKISGRHIPFSLLTQEYFLEYLKNIHCIIGPIIWMVAFLSSKIQVAKNE
jgi:hypothetical protein